MTVFSCLFDDFYFFIWRVSLTPWLKIMFSLINSNKLFSANNDTQTFRKYVKSNGTTLNHSRLSTKNHITKQILVGTLTYKKILEFGAQKL